ncbi:MAG: hypothetical protein WDO24_00900 [Pseudomonadota bacterium]
MRQLMLFGLPFLVPLALYVVWYARATRAAQAAGHAAPKLGDVPWPWLVGIAMLLLLGALGAYTTMGGGAPGGHYEPSRLIDGQIQPGRITR